MATKLQDGVQYYKFMIEDSGKILQKVIQTSNLTHL